MLVRGKISDSYCTCSNARFISCLLGDLMAMSSTWSIGDTLSGHNIFGVCTFPLWPFSFFVTSHKK